MTVVVVNNALVLTLQLSWLAVIVVLLILLALFRRK